MTQISAGKKNLDNVSLITSRPDEKETVHG